MYTMDVIEYCEDGGDWDSLCYIELMNSVSSHNSVLYTGYNNRLGITWANELNFGMKHAPDAGSIARPVALQTSTLPLCHGWLLLMYSGIAFYKQFYNLF